MRRRAGVVLGMFFLAHAAAAQFTQQGGKLVGTGAVRDSYLQVGQGTSVAISADGNTAIVGAPFDNFDLGAAWVFTRTGGVWSQQGGKLVGSGTVVAAQQGYSVAISADGNTAIVGGPYDNSVAGGAAWVYTRSGGVWSQQGSKLVGTGAIGGVSQGISVAISADGNTALVGGWQDNHDTGAVWVYTRSGGVWTQQGSKLVGTGAIGVAWQGTSVAISADGNAAIVGGWQDNSLAGAAWVFMRSGAVWSQQGSKLVGWGALVAANQGWSVGISADGNTAIVGGPQDESAGYLTVAGAAWVFTRSGGVWTQQGSKLVGTGAGGGAQQGTSVAISADGNTAIVGGPRDYSYPTYYTTGAAWVFTRSGGLWSQRGTKLVGTGAVGSDVEQGYSVAISADGNTAIVGGPYDNSYLGAAWVFVAAACAAPSITVQPQSQSIQSGQTATLSVTATGTTPLSYQWYQGNSGDTSKPVGTNASSCTTPALTATTSYWVRVKNSCGQADSATATVSVSCTLPSITVQPQNQSIPGGQTATLSVTATGTTPLSYQWYQGNAGDTSQPLGINANSFTTPALTATTSYWVRVSNACGHADSVTATITVTVTFLWVPVASHNPGLYQSQWRSDLGLLNTGTATANVQLSFYGSGGVVSNTTYVPAGTQSILTDVVGQLGGSGSGAIQVLSDQSLKVTARSYNQVSSSATCYAGGTQGQDYPTGTASGGLSAGQSAYLPGLTENVSYHCNIGLVNTGTGSATVLVELFNGAGSKLTFYTVLLSAGQWAQETQPFWNRAGQTAMDRGYAKMTVQSGSGIFGFASVIDNITNDPTTIAMLVSAWANAQFTQQGSKLIGSGALGAADQGYSVALSADGNTAIVGGLADNSIVGATWVYARSGGVWTQQGSKLVGTGGVGPYFAQGYSVAISGDGNTAIVGGPFDNGYAGAAWIFARSGAVWTQQGSKLVGTGAVAYQGTSVAISADGNTAIVGGSNDNVGAGAVWMFTRDSSGTWTQDGSKLVGAGAVGAAYQGSSVAISADGNTAVIGGPYDNSRAGAVWVYTRSGGVWTQQGSKLVGTGAVNPAYQGNSVAISADGNTAIVGGYLDNSAAGAAWVYTRSGGVWTQQGSKLIGTGAIAAARQGGSVAISADGNTAIVGGPADNSVAYGTWVYTRNGGVWTQQSSKLVGTGAVGTARQGQSVAISADGSTAIVGGPGDNSESGAAWIFSASPSFATWVPVASHTPGLNESQWRSDLGLLNIGTATANVQLSFYGSGGVLTNTTYVPAGTQSILTDVVGQIGGSGSGAIGVLSDQPLMVTARGYNQVSSSATCYPNGTQGQDYPTVTASNGLNAGQSAYLAGLTENAWYRCNIGLVNTGTGSATVLVELFNGAGARLTGYTESLAAGKWLQETQPFWNMAGQTTMDRGWAKLTVQSGSGIFGFASVIDNLTNDPTTVAMQR